MKCCDRCSAEIGYCLRDVLRARGVDADCEDLLIEVSENEEACESNS